MSYRHYLIGMSDIHLESVRAHLGSLGVQFDPKTSLVRFMSEGSETYSIRNGPYLLEVLNDHIEELGYAPLPYWSHLDFDQHDNLLNLAIRTINDKIDHFELALLDDEFVEECGTLWLEGILCRRRYLPEVAPVCAVLDTLLNHLGALPTWPDRRMSDGLQAITDSLKVTRRAHPDYEEFWPDRDVVHQIGRLWLDLPAAQRLPSFSDLYAPGPGETIVDMPDAQRDFGTIQVSIEVQEKHYGRNFNLELFKDEFSALNMIADTLLTEGVSEDVLDIDSWRAVEIDDLETVVVFFKPVETAAADS